MPDSYVYNQPRRPQLDVSGDFIRNHPEYDTDAERICRELRAMADELGDSPALSRAKSYLDSARQQFANHVERADRLWLERYCPSLAPTPPTEEQP